MDCLAGINDILPLIQSYYIESNITNNENIRLVEIGNTGMSDYLIHDDVVVSSPYFKMGNAKHIA